jgi:hypothetical protein
MQDIISQQAKEEITRRLRAAEQEHDVRILLAVESGSRAWALHRPTAITMHVLFTCIVRNGIYRSVWRKT